MHDPDSVAFSYYTEIIYIIAYRSALSPFLKFDKYDIHTSVCLLDTISAQQRILKNNLHFFLNFQNNPIK